MKIVLRKKSRDAMALVIVMIAVVVLTILAAAFAYSMKVETKLANTVNNDQRLVWMARNGMERARWYLVQEGSIPNKPYDALSDLWAGGAGNDSETNSGLPSLPETLSFGPNETITVHPMEDLERFANINTADTAELQQVMTVMGVQPDAMSTVCDSIQDWVDSDDAPRIAGAEDDYYQGLPRAYHCKNAPIDDLQELTLIKGIRDQLAIYDPKRYGPAGTDQRPTIFKTKLGIGTAPGQVPDYPFGFKDIFTPFSNGRVNINTADLNVLQTIPGVDPDIAASILKMRDGQDNVAANGPFKSVNELVQAGVNPQLVSQMNRYCGVRSSTYLVTVTAQIGDLKRDFKAILIRSGRNVSVNGFYWDTEDQPETKH